MDLDTVPRKMPIAVAKKRYKAVPQRNSGIEPAIGTPKTLFTMNVSDRPTAIVMINPFAQTFDIAISNGLTGMTIRWSMVLCSLSRITAAPAMMMASIVTLLMIPMTLVNQEVTTFGLKAKRSATAISGVAVSLLRATNSSTFALIICCA